MLSCSSSVSIPVLIWPRRVNLLIFLLSRMIGSTDAGKTKKAMDARTQSFKKATTIKTTSEVESFKKEASASVIEYLKSETSLLTRDRRVPLGCRWKKETDKDWKCRLS